jgi:hypothetical protein
VRLYTRTYIYQGEESRTGKLGQESQNGTGGTEQERKNGIVRAGQADRTRKLEMQNKTGGRKRQNWTGRTGHAEQESRNVTGRQVRTGQAERDKQKQDRQNVESRTGQRE